MDTSLWLTPLKTPLGEMIALGDPAVLYVLTFIDDPQLKRKLTTVCDKKGHTFKKGNCESTDQVRQDLTQYFEGGNPACTPIQPLGTPFQERVWSLLRLIPYGETRPYSFIAESLGNPRAYRAVAQANGANPIAILVPCHRVINKDTSLGGYASGVHRKRKLLALEGQILKER